MGNKTAKQLSIFALLAASALLLSGCTAPTVCDDKGLVSGDFTALWNSWQGALTTGVLIIFLISGMVYILGGLIMHRGLIVWAKNQIYEGFVTLIFALFAVMLVGFICSMDVNVLDASCVDAKPAWWDASLSNFCSGDGCFDAGTQWGSCNMFDVADYYLQTFRNSAIAGFYLVFVMNMVVSAIASAVLALVVTGVGPTISFGQGLSPIVQQLSNAMVAIAGAQLLIMAQINLLKVSMGLFGFVFPAGIILRSFGITRGFGGSLIAIAIGFGLIYPLATVLSYGLLQNQMDTQMSTAQTDLPSDYSGDWAASSSNICGFVAVLLIGSVLAPFIVFIIVISFTKGLSGVLGEEVDVSNLTRLV